MTMVDDELKTNSDDSVHCPYVRGISHWTLKLANASATLYNHSVQ
ncbi:MAG: hypothetical protein ACI9LY_002954 [Arenicella sp.]|jgi:hypothetical protein